MEYIYQYDQITNHCSNVKIHKTDSPTEKRKPAGMVKNDIPATKLWSSIMMYTRFLPPAGWHVHLKQYLWTINSIPTVRITTISDVITRLCSSMRGDAKDIIFSQFPSWSFSGVLARSSMSLVNSGFRFA